MENYKKSATNFPVISRVFLAIASPLLLPRIEQNDRILERDAATYERRATKRERREGG